MTSQRLLLILTTVCCWSAAQGVKHIIWCVKSLFQLNNGCGLTIHVCRKPDTAFHMARGCVPSSRQLSGCKQEICENCFNITKLREQILWCRFLANITAICYRMMWLLLTSTKVCLSSFNRFSRNWQNSRKLAKNSRWTDLYKTNKFFSTLVIIF